MALDIGALQSGGLDIGALQSTAGPTTTEITPPAGAIFIAGQAPTVFVGVTTLVTPGAGSVLFSSVGPTIYNGAPLDPLNRGVCLIATRSVKHPPFEISPMPSERKGT